jgi:glycosyltransferase involved in cell wall biosynthesis
VAHLREEKDPFLAARAAQLLPASSRVRVFHVGGPLQEGMAEQAIELESPRWHWLGAVSHGATRQRIARAHLLVISSRMEGGANVICEAVASGTPVLASAISGNVGMLGGDYAGYFPVGDAAALATLLSRCETDPAFLALLQHQCALRAPLFTPEREAAGIQSLIEEFR